MTDYLHTELLGFYVRSFDALTTRELYEMLRARADVFVGEQKILFPDTDERASPRYFLLLECRMLCIIFP